MPDPARAASQVDTTGAELFQSSPPTGRRHGRSWPVGRTRLLSALHAAPLDRMADLVDRDDPPLAQWRDEAAELYSALAGQVPVVRRGPIEGFLDAPPPQDAYRPVFSHNDLGIEHVLIDQRETTVSGIIDWSDAAVVDPAYDFGLLYRDLGTVALDAAMGSYRTEVNDVSTLRRRAAFYARCSVFEDLAYGLETGQDKYVDKSMAAMQWLFPGSSSMTGASQGSATGRGIR